MRPANANCCEAWKCLSGKSISVPEQPDRVVPLTAHKRGLNGLEFRQSDLPEIIQQIRTRTPARLLRGRAGSSYRTSTQLELREAHAAARDAVRTELDLNRD